MLYVFFITICTVLSLQYVNHAIADEKTSPYPDNILPTERFILPPESVAVSEEGHSFVFNPAGPAFTLPLSLEVYNTVLPDSPHSQGELSRGFYFSIPFIRFSWQHIIKDQELKHAIASFSLRKRITDSFYLGTNFNYHFFKNTDPSPGNRTSPRIGIMYRPSSKVSFGLVAENITSPTSRYKEFQTQANFGVAYRPKNENLTISLDLRTKIIQIAEKNSSSALLALQYKPFSGVSISAFIEQLGLWNSKPKYTSGLSIDFKWNFLGLASSVETFSQNDKPVAYSSMQKTVHVALYGKQSRSIFNELGKNDQIWQVSINDDLKPPQKEGYFTTSPPKIRLFFQLQRLQLAENDKRVKAVLLNIGPNNLSLSEIKEIQIAIASIQAKGKKVFAYLQRATINDLYLASVCDEVIIHPDIETYINKNKHEYVESNKKDLEQLYILNKKEEKGYLTKENANISDLYGLQLQIKKTNNLKIKEQLWHDILETQYGSTELKQGSTDVNQETERTEGQETTEILYRKKAYPYEISAYLKDNYKITQPLIKDDRISAITNLKWGPQSTLALVVMDSNYIKTSEDINSYTKYISKTLKHISKDRNIKSVILRIESPLSINQNDETLNKYINELFKKKTVIVSWSTTISCKDFMLLKNANFHFALDNTKIIDFTENNDIDKGNMYFGGYANAINKAKEITKLKKDTTLWIEIYHESIPHKSKLSQIVKMPWQSFF